MTRWLIRLSLIFCAGLVGAPISAQVAAPPLELTFHARLIEPEVSPEGFVEGSDKTMADSVRDLVRIMDGAEFRPNKGYPGSRAKYRHVTDLSQADIVLTIVARGINSESFGSRTEARFYRGVVLSETTPIVGNTRWVSMILSVDTYQKEIVGGWTNTSIYSLGAWSEAAKILATNAAAWVMANEPQIVKRRAERLGVPVSEVVPKQPTCMTRDAKVIPCTEPESRPR